MQMHYMDEYICVHEPEISRFKIKLTPYVWLMSARVGVMQWESYVPVRDGASGHY